MSIIQKLLPTTALTLSTNKPHSLQDALLLPEWENAKLIEMEQTHGDGVMIVERASQDKLSNVDAVLTTRAGIGLAVRTADCLPVLIHHPSGLIGAVHAGRKGTEAGILSKVGKIIKTDFNLEEGLHFWFGPAICNQCYQIDEQKDLHYNLLRNNTDQLYKIFKPEKINIHFANICTLEHPEYHSYRETGQGVEMNYSAIVLPKS